MITAIINPEKKSAIICYPDFSKQKPVKVDVRSYSEAKSILRIRTLKFISNEIRSFIKMRKYAYIITHTYTNERVKAIERLQFIIDSYSEGSVERLAKFIVNSRVSFSTLMPVKPSSIKTYFDNHIIPIINYCESIYTESIKK